jgi:DNA-binding GntR family transcriptional regulator
MSLSDSSVAAGEPRPGVNAIPRRSAKDAVVEEVRTSILRGDLKAGARLREHHLAASLNVSQTTVREALVDLEHLGFVQRVPPRKTFVTRLTRRDIDEIYAVRVPLEQVVIDALAELPSFDLAQVKQAYEGMRSAAAAENRLHFEEMDLSFHRALWAASGNHTLSVILEKLVVRLFAFGFVMNQQIHSTRARMEEQAEQHRSILNALRGRNFEEAKRLMAASMDKGWLNEIDFSEGPDDSDSN